MDKILDIICGYCETQGAVFGVCGGSPLVIPENIDLSDVPFMPYDRILRVDPNESLKGVKSVIVIGVPFKGDILEGLNGIIAPSLAGFDYHKHLRSILEGFRDKLTIFGDFNYVIQVDSGPLLEREYAVKAGLGNVGLNRSIINKKLGSLFNIGLLLTDLDIPLNKCEVFPLNCANCKLCIKNCPTGALSENTFDYKICRSYLTQKKGVLTSDELDLMGDFVYGCDICLKSCPYNNYENIFKSVEESEITENLKRLLNLTRENYENLYKLSNFYWRGRNLILRNVLISLGKRRNGYDEIKKFMDSGSFVLKETAKQVADCKCQKEQV